MIGNKVITKATQNTFSQWDEIGNIGKSLGFRWGKSFNEVWHFDMGFDFATTELLQKFNNNDLVDGFVSLNKSGTITTDQYNGQDYKKNTSTNSEIAVNVPCDESKKFNKDHTIEETHPTNSTSDEKETASGSIDNSTLDCREQNAKLLLDRIAEGEGTTSKSARKEGVDSAYDITYSYGKFTPEKLPSGKNVQPISTLTIGEIKQVQALMLKKQAGRNLPSSAVGRYQFISTTLNELAQKAGMSDDIIFSPDTQDKLAIQKLKGRGYDKWISNQIGDDAFQTALAKEWASIADINGKSYYNQHVGTTDSQIKDIMDQIKKSNC
jgi:conjugal transfer mating pair stabilization protein TraG